MANVTLTYFVSRGLLRADVLVNRVAAIVVDRGERELLGFTLVSDTTVSQITDDVATGNVVRTIVLQQTTQGAKDLPNETVIKAATKNLYGNQIASCLPGHVSPGEPVVS